MDGMEVLQKQERLNTMLSEYMHLAKEVAILRRQEIPSLVGYTDHEMHAEITFTKR